MTVLVVDLWRETRDGLAPASLEPGMHLRVGDTVTWQSCSSHGIGTVTDQQGDTVWVKLDP